MRAAQDHRPRTAILLQFTGIGDLIWHIHYFRLIAERSRNGHPSSTPKRRFCVFDEVASI